MRRLAIILGVLLVLFGGLCLNYTKAGSVEHHGEWASERSLPAPSDAIMWGGGAAIAFGSFLVGAGTMGRRGAPRRA